MCAEGTLSTPKIEKLPKQFRCVARNTIFVPNVEFVITKLGNSKLMKAESIPKIYSVRIFVTRFNLLMTDKHLHTLSTLRTSEWFQKTMAPYMRCSGSERLVIHLPTHTHLFALRDELHYVLAESSGLKLVVDRNAGKVQRLLDRHVHHF